MHNNNYLCKYVRHVYWILNCEYITVVILLVMSMVIFQIQIFWVMMLLSVGEWFPVIWNARNHSYSETVSWTQQCYCHNWASGKDFLHLGFDNVDSSAEYTTQNFQIISE